MEAQLMRKIKKVMDLLRVNWRTMAEFEILYKVLSLTIFTPLFLWAFNGIMNITGYQYLTIENIFSFFLNPLTLLALLLLIVCMAVYAMVDIGAVIFLLDQSYQGKKADLVQTVRYALHNAARVFHRKNILVVFVVLFLIPFLNIGVASGYVGSIAVPEFIMDFIKGNVHLLLLFSGVLIGLSVLLLRWMYAFHYFTLEGCGFKEARKRSVALSGKNKMKDFVALVGVQLGLSVLFFVFAMLGVGLAVFLGGVFSRLKLVGIISASVVWVYLAVSLLVLSAFGTPISYACISILFYAHKEDRQENIIHGEADKYQEKEKRRKIRYAAEGVILLGAVVCCCFYLYGIYNHKVSVQIEYVRTMEVTAHRGASARYPENTMAAFEGAKELGADWIELDVQQSRNGHIFVMHDANFGRGLTIAIGKWIMMRSGLSCLRMPSYAAVIFSFGLLYMFIIKIQKILEQLQIQ